MMAPGFLWSAIERRLRRRLPGSRVDPILVDLFDDYVPRRERGRLGAAWWLVREARSLERAYRAEARLMPKEPRASMIEVLLRELRLGARSLARTPGVTAAIGLTLALAIGANAAIFAIVNGVLLRPLPYPDEARVVSIAHRSPGGTTDIPSAPYLYFTYRDSAHTLERVGLWTSGLSTVTGLDRPEQVRALYVTHEILPLLGAAPVAGQLISEKDDEPGSPLKVVLSWGYWQRRFGGNQSAIGRALTIDQIPATVAGVLPRTFRFLDQPVDVIYPFQLDQTQVTLGRYVFQSLARLRPGVSIAAATTDLAGIVPAAIQRFPAPAGYTRDRFASRPVAPHLTPVKESVVGDIGRTLWVLMGALGIVLVIACANVVHLLLVRADSRRRSLAVQAALGASRGRIVMGHLVEGVLFAAIGGVGGLGVAYLVLQTVLALGPANLPRADAITIDPFVVAVTLAVSLVSGLCLGLSSLIRLGHSDLAPSLTDGGRGMSEGRERRRTRGVLVVAQVALALVLLVCSGLMIRTFQRLTSVAPGFARPEEVQLVYVAAAQPDPNVTTRLQHDIVNAIAALPGVTSVGFADRALLDPSNGRRSDTVLTADASIAPRVEGQPRPLRRFEFISPAYFQTIGTPMLAGRDFSWIDLERGRPVAIVSAELAKQEWGTPAAALGKRVQVTPADTWREVVGVAGDIHDNGMQASAPPMAYFPARVENFWGAPAMAFGNATIAIRSARAGNDSLIRDIERAVATINPDLPVSQARRLSDDYRGSLARTSFALTLLLVAGALGLALGVIGIYGVVAHSVSQRTREVGIRLALGAQRGEVTRLFLRRGVALASVGLAAGVAAAAMATRLMSTLLFGVSPVDPMTYALVASFVLTVVTIAAYIPARRATRAGCANALRSL